MQITILKKIQISQLKCAPQQESRIQKYWALLLILLVSSTAFAQNITVSLHETSEAFKNPMKGFRPSRYIQDSSFPSQEYASVYKHYIKYTDLEYNANDSVEKIKSWSNAAWAGIENKNIKVIPRIVISYPNGPDGGEYWADGIPHDGTPSEWTSNTLQSRIVTLIGKLGQAWDNDPRVAAIEIGFWGHWGELHIYPDKLPDGTDRIPISFQYAIGQACTRAFPTKKVMVRYPETFTAFNFGYFWDSFALPDDAGSGNGIIAKGNWNTQMVSGEVAYDWGNQTNLGGSPNGNLSSQSNTNYVISWIQYTHASSLGWISDYDASNSTIAANAATVQKELGYRYVIGNVTFSSEVDPGSTMALSFNITNKGNAPFYYHWPVKASLLREDKSVAWSADLGVDIRNWLPKNSYNVSDTITLPANLETGIYTLALSINDPAGDTPSLRFANTNYYTGGWTPIGKVGVGQQPADQNLGSFNALKNDTSLHYSLNFVSYNGSGSTSSGSTSSGSTSSGSTSSGSTSSGSTSSGSASSGSASSGSASSGSTSSGSASSGSTTPPSTMSPYTIAASNESFTNGATLMPCNVCATGQKVGYIGNNSGILQFNNVAVDRSGLYTLTVYYFTAEDRYLSIGVNGQSATNVMFRSTGGWNNEGSVGINVNLNAGNNTVRFFNASGWAPDIDKIKISPSTSIAGLMLNSFDTPSNWPGRNDLGKWTGANGFINGGGVISKGALTLQYNGSGWFGSDINQDLSQYTKMVIRIKGLLGGEQKHFKMRIGNAYKFFSEFTATPITTDYQNIVVDLIKNGVNRSTPGQLNFEFWYGGNSQITIDEIYFE